MSGVAKSDVATWLVLAAALGASVWAVRRADVTAPVAVTAPRKDLADLVPPGPQLVVTADVAALGAVAAQELLRLGGGALLGLRETCGFEPVLALRRVAFTIPQSAPGHDSDFAFLAETSLQPEPALRCAEQVIRKRGGVPVRSHLGAFTSVRDQQKPLGEMAIRADGVFVLSGGQYFRDIMDAASGTITGDEAARLRTQAHAALRRKLSPAMLSVTMLAGNDFPLPGVQAFGASLDVAQQLTLRGFVSCYSDAGCSETQASLRQLQQSGGFSALSGVQMQQHERQLELRAVLPREQLGALLSQLL